MDYLHIAASGRLAHGDLVAADKALEAAESDHAVRLVLIKQLLISCANITDLELTSRGLYKQHPKLNELYSPYRHNFDFVKYLRNIAVGHVNPALCAKAFEWRPELNVVITQNTPGANAFMSYAVLETAINSYVDGEKHKIFDSETDLAYPPDLTRFLNLLGDTVRVGIAFTEALATAALGQIQLPDYETEFLNLAMKAGKTDFAFITRKS